MKIIQGYEEFTTITREVLNGIKEGDLIKCNEWKKPKEIFERIFRKF